MYCRLRQQSARQKNPKWNPVGRENRQGAEKKILNEGNKPKDSLKTKELAFLAAQNKPNFKCKQSQERAKQSLKPRVEDSVVRLREAEMPLPEVMEGVGSAWEFGPPIQPKS